MHPQFAASTLDVTGATSRRDSVEPVLGFLAAVAVSSCGRRGRCGDRHGDRNAYGAGALGSEPHASPAAPATTEAASDPAPAATETVIQTEPAETETVTEPAPPVTETVVETETAPAVTETSVSPTVTVTRTQIVVATPPPEEDDSSISSEAGLDRVRDPRGGPRRRRDRLLGADALRRADPLGLHPVFFFFFFFLLLAQGLGPPASQWTAVALSPSRASARRRAL